MQLQSAAITTSQHFIQAFSWMLLHSLWQGLLLAMFGGFLLVLTKKSRSTVRYNLLLVQLVLFITACILTFAWEWNKSPVPGFAGAISNRAHARLLFFELNASGLKQFANNCIYWVSANSPLIVLLWLILFIVRSMRLMGSLVYVHRARHRFVYQPSEYWAGRVELLCRKLQLSRTVQLLESGYVKVPMVIGHLKPIILVPVGLIAGLPSGQVEAILLHELAHIRRHDYVVNIIQTIAETVFCFNPGLLWISSVLRDERENCCDDVALAQTKNKKEFVQALISFKEHALYGTKYQVAFPGKKNHLLNRVSRIISNKNRTFGPSEKTSFMVGIVVLSAMITTAAVTGSRHIRAAMMKSRTEIANSPVGTPDIQKRRVAAHITIQKVRITHNVKTSSADAVPASNHDSLQFVADETSVNRSEAVEATEKKAGAEPAQAQRVAAAPSAEKLQADRDGEQAKKDQAQAAIDQEQGHRDQIQATKDRQDALKDQEQARHDQEQAQRDQQQAQLNQLQAEKNAEQDARNKEQARLNEVQSKKNEEQVTRNQQQVARNQEQARVNEIQENKNRKQARLNEIQAKKNEQRAKQNNASVQE